jgi:hypothetical protein
MPFFPRVFKKSCPIGRGRVVVSTSGTDLVAKEAAIRKIHPRPEVPATPMRIAKGAARAAPATYEINLD